MLEGKILSERYKLKKLIGGGGMANVFFGTDLILNRDVAIKVLRLEYADDDEFISRFHREAQAATSLSHPNIVSIYDVGEEGNIYYIVMEYINGMTLKQYIQLHAPVEVEEVLDIMKQITSGIAHAHDNGIIHRDIKPQNMLIDEYGLVKVTDFGIATALSATALTQTNSVLGSIHYLSPEQARGVKANNKSDIYALGIVMFELLTGNLPFSGQSPVSIALKHMQREMPSVHEWQHTVPQSVENIILIATTKAPYQRYQNAHEMLSALDHALDPDQRNVPKYIPESVHDEDQTKAIPIQAIEKASMTNTNTDKTMVHTNNAEDNAETDKNDKKKRSKKKIIIWTTTIFFALFGAFLLALFVFPSLFQPEDVQIPDVSGKSYDEAVQMLEERNLVPVKEEQSDEEVEEGIVIETSPKADETVKENRDVTVIVSSGPQTLEMEDYIGENYERTKSLLEEQGFKVIEYSVFSERPAGEIVSQHQPEAGAEVVPARTTVIFEVSEGLQSFPLNRLVGMTQSEATNYLSNNELSPVIEEVYHDEVAEGLVIEQSPQPSTDMVSGDEVTLVISKGPDEPEQVTHTETFTVPYTNKSPSPDEEEQANTETANEPTPQSVSIYVEDVNHNIEELYEEVQLITENTTFDIHLTIARDDNATYRVLRDDQLLIEKTIKYEDVKGE
ncbi:Stk1 family PASTA domain-containing Ser/Thr kinase [Gracilibacillus oryzae]|uniref:Serine/threonine-protein kinase PrkC n=1 Tax=Gracilibacillus oryzae TaxID=1672701 RepID=A0A7C8KX49_9BACI|nr:Stk1 family PASTA domain-containing Ser/Thr kinase [Gracilibacillus oryzae]KAB8138693.1 Stk1 family PASTA domain-containing Ser/Thr kinase [Gracilibacillus oryzae]